MTLAWLPNMLTFARIAAAPVIGWFILAADPAKSGGSSFLFWAGVIFVVAGVTDGLDGLLARRLQATSKLGAALDLWADKILVFVTLLALLKAQAWLALIGLVSLTLRDVIIMWLRAAYPAENLGATGLAKVKTVLVMSGLAMILFALALAQNSLFLLGLGLFGLGCALSLVAGYQYARAAFSNQAP